MLFRRVVALLLGLLLLTPVFGQRVGSVVGTGQEPRVLADTDEVTPVTVQRTLDMFLKTNPLTLPLLIPSLGLEFQFAPHLSLGALGYHSSFDWFLPDFKFRVSGIQPELRYWLRRDMKGLFIAAHFNFAWYNMAFGGDYRYQDHDGNTPAMGGGLNVGFKTPLGSKPDSRWGVEFSLGAGVLPLYYDIFYNVPGGRLAGEERKTYIGLDNAAVTFTYRFGRLSRERRAK